MKLIKITALVLAAAMLCVASAVGAAVEASDYYGKQLEKLERMKQKTVSVSLEFRGDYTVKRSKLYAREITGLDSSGNYILGPWKLVSRETDVQASSDLTFDLPQTATFLFVR